MGVWSTPRVVFDEHSCPGFLGARLVIYLCVQHSQHRCWRWFVPYSSAFPPLKSHLATHGGLLPRLLGALQDVKLMHVFFFSFSQCHCHETSLSPTFPPSFFSPSQSSILPPSLPLSLPTPLSLCLCVCVNENPGLCTAAELHSPGPQFSCVFKRNGIAPPPV